MKRSLQRSTEMAAIFAMRNAFSTSAAVAAGLPRHAPGLTNADYHGVDYNGRLVEWCSSNLPGRYSQNQLSPPLKFADGYFDVLYLLSVFTHLRIPTQNEWLAEYARVLKPGGICIVTFHDEDHENMGMTEITREKLLAEGTAIHNNEAEGSNYIATYQSREFARKQFGEFFEVCEIQPSNATPVGQAFAVLRKR